MERHNVKRHDFRNPVSESAIEIGEKVWRFHGNCLSLRTIGGIKMSKSKLSHRITWHVVLILTVINMLVILLVFNACLEVSKTNAQMRAQHLIDGVDGKLETVLRAVEKVSTNNVTEIENHLDSPESIFSALENELRLNPAYLGCGVAFEPDYYPSEGRWFEPYVLFKDSTTIERRQIGSAQHDYLNQEWYQKGIGLERGNGYLVDPYIDEDGAKQLVSSYLKPVFDSQGRKVGVFGIDISLGWLEKTTKDEEAEIKRIERVEDDNLNFFFIQVVDSKGKKIAGSESFDEETLQTIMKEDKIDFMIIELNDNSYFITSKRISSAGWTLVVAQNKHFVFLIGYVIGFIILLFMAIGGIVIFFFLRRSIKRAIRPLRYLNDSAKEVAQGNFDTPLPSFKRQDEISQLRDSFDTMQQSLKQYVEDLKVTTAAKASIESELKVAHRIQMSMVPNRFPKREKLDLYAKMIPAKAVGGDLYNYVVQGDRLYICVGDVSGKGVPASLFMAQTTRLFRALSKEGMMPAEMAVRMNNELAEDNGQCMFVTMFIGLIDLKTGRLDYCSCGHNPPVIDGEFLQVVHKNKPLGLMGGIPFKGESIDDIRGRQILIYTDGLTEAENQARELLGDDQLLRLMNSVTSLSGQEIITMLTEAVDQFRDGAEPSDDLTLMCLKINNHNI